MPFKWLLAFLLWIKLRKSLSFLTVPTKKTVVNAEIFGVIYGSFVVYL